ncbi:MAG: transcription termination factor NusA [Candidatus Cloacimonadota bacterium]|nr:transcription termination factor NusA [Candidatus Cloacimonadota bacterium]
MGLNLLSSIEEFARIKQIDRSKIATIIRESLESTLEKKLHTEELSVEINFEKGEITANLMATVVEETPLNLGEISLEKAREFSENIEVDDEIPLKIPITNFGRKTIQAARQSIINRIKESESDKMQVDYEKQKGELVSGVVKKIEYNGYIVNIGFTDALLPTDEQVENEFYKSGDYIKTIIYDIRKEKKGLRVILSRKRSEFIVKLFESEIPEIIEKQVIIKKIVREPGYRTKIAVYSKNSNIDAFGSCVGQNGVRIEDIKKELHGERIDVVEFHENLEEFIKNSLGTGLVKRVYLAERGRFAQVIVENDKKNIAIGKGGKNVKLAAKLTNYKIDVLVDSEYEEMAAKERRVTSKIFELDGVSQNIGDVLYKAGYTSVQDIHESSIEEICNIEGIGKKTAIKLKESSKNF